MILFKFQDFNNNQVNQAGMNQPYKYLVINTISIMDSNFDETQEFQNKRN